MKKILCTILCLVLVLAMIPMVAGTAIAGSGIESTDYLCFTAIVANSTVKLTKVGTPSDISLLYSTDKVNWEPYAINNTVTLTKAEDKVYFRASGTNLRISNASTDYHKFEMTGGIEASGNIMSLLDATCQSTIIESGSSYCFGRLFEGCASLTAAPKLPATTLAGRCYSAMFKGCTSLTAAPELPTATLADYCYEEMFQGCSSLTTAPKLPATTIKQYCYMRMFQDCSSLTTAPELPATTLYSGCYCGMFEGCSSLTTAPRLPATTVVYNCYCGMFSGCSNLTVAPVLPATTLASLSNAGMFNRCTSLKKLVVGAKEFKDDTWWKIGASEWLNEVSLDTITCPTGTDINAYHIPNNPTRIDSIDIQSISVPASMDLTVNETRKITASVSPTDATFKDYLVYTSSDTDVATVDGYGNIKGIKAGTTTITVSDAGGTVSGSCTVTVRERVSYSYSSAVYYNVTVKKSEHGTATVDKSSVTSGGTVKITVKPDEGYVLDKILVNGVETTGLEIKNIKQNTEISVSFKPNDKALIEKIEKCKIEAKTTTSKTIKNSIKITWEIDGGDLKLADLDNYEIYRSTKKNSGYGKKPYFTSSKPDYGYYVNNKGLKKGKTYYYKVRGFKVIDGEKYYTPWSTKCWRTVK